MQKKSLHIATQCVRELSPKVTTRPHQLPIFATSSFEMESVDQSIDIFTGQTSGHVYSRYGNPTIDTVAEKLAQLESFGTEIEPFALLTSSGMSAISVLMLSLLRSGDKIVTQGNLYGGTTELLVKVLSQYGIETIFTDLNDIDTLARIIKGDSSVRMLYLETPANPTSACVDIEQLTQLAKACHVYTCVDNTFCTPYLQQPLKLGADFVIHSTTKYLNGHGNSISGVIIGRDKAMRSKVFITLKLLGATCNPFDAWLLNNGLKTLAIRMDRHCSNALELAKFLENHPSVLQVNYCGLPNHSSHHTAKKQMLQFGGMMSFEVRGGKEAAAKVIDHLKLATHAPTLGDVDTLVLHPATSSHLNVDPEMRKSQGITDGLIRVSVGIENIEDLKDDFGQALKSI
jgi:methionine-gamma-lyase